MIKELVVDGRMDKWMSGWMDECVGGWTSGWMDEWVGGWMDGEKEKTHEAWCRVTQHRWELYWPQMMNLSF